METRSLPLAVLKDSLATARGTDSEVVCADRNLASHRPTFVQTLTASGPGWRITNSRDQSGAQRALKRHRKDRNIDAAGGVYLRHNTHSFSLDAYRRSKYVRK